MTSCKLAYHSTMMQSNLENPPTLAAWRPLQYEHQGSFPSTLKLRHHFFLCRLKVAMLEIYARPPDVYLYEGLRQEVVCVLLLFFSIG